MITKWTAPGGGQGVNIPSCVAFRIQAGSVGATFRLDGSGAYPIIAGEVYRFPGQITQDATAPYRYPDVFVTAGTNVPVQIIASQFDGRTEHLSEDLGSGTFPQVQEGDTITSPGTTTTVGAIGIPVLVRPATGGKLIIPNATVSGALVNSASNVQSYDLTTGIGAPQSATVLTDTLIPGTACIGVVIDITTAGGGAFAASHSLSVSWIRTDASTALFFTGAATVAIGLNKFTIAAGMGAGPIAANGVDMAFAGPVAPNGISVLVGAGAGDSIRITAWLRLGA
jgi:hypothetical protein